MALAFLKRFWPFLAGAALLIGAWLWHASEVRSARQDGYQKAQSEYTAALAKQREADLAKHQEQARAWQVQMADLQRRSVTVLSQPVRLCLSAPSLPAADPAPSSADAGVGPRHALPPSRDIGPAMREYGAECERYRRALRAAQQ